MRLRVTPMILAFLTLGASAGVLVIEVLSPHASPRLSSSAAATEPDTDMASANNVTAPRLEASQEVVGRPLFFASRRPLPPVPVAVAEAKPQPDPPLNFALVGTILTQTSKIALVKPDKAAVQEMSLGDDVGGWTVSTIDDDRMMVRHGATQQLVGLREIGGGQRLPAAVKTALAAPARTLPAPTSQSDKDAATRRPPAHR